MKKVFVSLTSVVIVFCLVGASSLSALGGSVSPSSDESHGTDKSKCSLPDETLEKISLFSAYPNPHKLNDSVISSMYPDYHRWAQVSIDSQIHYLSSSNINDTIQLNLFDNLTYNATIKTVYRNVMNTTVTSGSIDNYFFGTFIIAMTESSFLVTIEIPEENKSFVAHPTEDTNVAIVVQRDLRSLRSVPSAPPVILEDEEDDISSRQTTYQELENENEEITPIDVMIVYTPAAKDLASRFGGIHNVIATAIQKGQIVLENSQTFVHLNLVYAAEVNYTESGSTQTDLSRLRNPTDGYMDEIHEWRDTYGADLVQLFTYIQNEGVAGMAYLLNTRNGRPDAGFSVVGVQFASTGYTSIHEFGHNLGCHHHINQNVEPGPTNWGHTWEENRWSAGWRWPGSGTSRYCTVMTYPPGEYFPHDPYDAYQVPYFSNPNINCVYTGLSMGHAVHGDNARTIREIRHVIAGYREQSFVNHPPYQPHTPMPRDEANDVSMPLAILSWYGGDPNAMDQVNYTIYFGTEPDPPFWGTVGPWIGFPAGPLTTHLEISLDPDTTYYWMISAEDSHGATSQGPVWSFTTGPMLWNLTEVVSTDGNWRQYFSPSLFVGLDGTVHVAWYCQSNEDIFYKCKPVDESWTTTERMNSIGSKSPSLAVDDSGTVHIAWHNYWNNEILYRYKTPGGGWSTVEQVNTESLSQSRFPSLAVDNMGTVHIAWEDNTDYEGCGSQWDIFYKSKPVGGNWPTDTEVVSREDPGNSYHPSLVVDRSGVAHIAWQWHPGGGVRPQIIYKYKPVVGVWSDQEVVSTESVWDSAYPSLAVDAEGNVHVAWHEESYENYVRFYDIRYKYKPVDKNWNTTEKVSTESPGHSWFPSLAIDAWGTVHVAWQDKTNYGGSGSDWDIFYKSKPVGGSWPTDTEIVSTESNSDSEHPSLSVDRWGTVHVAWQDRTVIDGILILPHIFYKYKGPPVVPVVSTNAAEVGYRSARLHGTLTSSGGQACQIRFRYRSRVSEPSWAISETTRWIYVSDWNGSYTSGQSFHDIVLELEPDTIYVFQAGARNVAGEVWGSMYRFRTLSENQPPFVPTSPYPSDEAVDVSVFVELGWTGGDPDPGDMVTYDVYFGSSNPPEKQVSNQSAFIYEPGMLNYGTTYYWRIVAWDNHGSSTSGPLWTFSTVPLMNNWRPVEVVSTESTRYSGWSSLVVDNLGVVHVVWQDQTNILDSGTDMDIFYKYKSPGSVWSEPQLVSAESDRTSQHPTLFVDSSRTVHVAWQDMTNFGGSDWDVDIFYKYKPLGSNWSMTEVVSMESTEYSWNPSLFVDNYGWIHIVWEDLTPSNNRSEHWDILYKYKPPGGDWSAPQLVSTESTGISCNPSLAVDMWGMIHVAWEDYTNHGGSDWDADIFYKSKYFDEPWPTITEVVSTESTGDSKNPSLAVDADGTVHIVWEDNTDYNGSGPHIFYKAKVLGVSWTTTEVVSTESTEYSWNPSLFVDNLWTVHIAWEDATNYQGCDSDVDIFYKSKLYNGFWGITEVVSTSSTSNSFNPSLAVDAGGNVHVAWHDNTDYEGSGIDYDIFYRFREYPPS